MIFAEDARSKSTRLQFAAGLAAGCGLSGEANYYGDFEVSDASWDEKAVFLAALDLPKTDRAAYLNRACSTKEQRERIELLLRHHDTVTLEALQVLEETEKDGGQSRSIASRRIEEFQILKLLGEGGMGTVYLAEDLLLNRRVALKVLAPGLTDSEEALARFRTEARSAAAIQHPAIVPVYKFGFDGETHYIVTEYVEGSTLASLIRSERERSGGRPATTAFRDWTRRAAEMVCNVALALEAAHQRNIIHRDVKPSNILIDARIGPRLTDFGIAKHLTAETANEFTALVGTCHYMSPEQASAAKVKVDQRSDVFSLGVVMFELLTLSRPFEGASHAEILRAVQEQATPRLRQADPRFPRDLEVICQKALEKEPADRYQTAGHLAADLRCFLNGQPILAKPPGVSRRVRFWVRQRRIALLVSSCGVLILLAVFAAWWARSSHNETLGWLTIESNVPSAEAYLQRVNPTTLDLDEAPRRLGTLPRLSLKLLLGQYRVTVVEPNGGGFIEFNAILLDPGKDNKLSLFAIDESLPGVPSREVTPKDRWGYFRGDDPGRLEGMILINAGEYTFGWSDMTDVLDRKRKVRLRAFYIDKCEVSNREYKAFVDATKYPEPDHWQFAEDDDEVFWDLPVVAVRQRDAEAYALWLGKRLPIAAEWQAAARGPQGWNYPWGNDWKDAPEWITVDLSVVQAARQSRTKLEYFEAYRDNVVLATTSDALVTSGGLPNAFQNVSEITESVHLLQRDIVYSGRSWADDPRSVSLGRILQLPLETYSYKLGFRCAGSAASVSVNHNGWEE